MKTRTTFIVVLILLLINSIIFLAYLLSNNVQEGLIDAYGISELTPIIKNNTEQKSVTIMMKNTSVSEQKPSPVGHFTATSNLVLMNIDTNVFESVAASTNVVVQNQSQGPGPGPGPEPVQGPVQGPAQAPVQSFTVDESKVIILPFLNTNLVTITNQTNTVREVPLPPIKYLPINEVIILPEVPAKLKPNTAAVFPTKFKLSLTLNNVTLINDAANVNKAYTSNQIVKDASGNPQLLIVQSAVGLGSVAPDTDGSNLVYCVLNQRTTSPYPITVFVKDGSRFSSIRFQFISA